MEKEGSAQDLKDIGSSRVRVRVRAVCMATSGTGSVLFIDDVTADKNKAGNFLKHTR